MAAKYRRYPVTAHLTLKQMRAMHNWLSVEIPLVRRWTCDDSQAVIRALSAFQEGVVNAAKEGKVDL